MKSLFLYLHTHWDREWYLPFETFRVHLGKVVSAVLDGLETGELPSFYLDGQSVALEDATAIHGDFTERLKALIAEGRLAAGPWYVLADQMLVAGESLVRNLARGIASTSQFGSPAMIGYCPDTFGHSADLPRILQGFGIKTAVVWRGVPKLPAEPIFTWESPDGSSVNAFHLSRGYYQSSFHERIDTEELAVRLLSWLQPAAGDNSLADPYLLSLDGALHPVGCDHLGPPEEIREKIRAVRDLLTGKLGEPVDIVVVPLAQFLSKLEQSLPAEERRKTVIAGELRSNSAAKLHANAYLLPGVLSTRLYLKRENRLAEHRLITLSEPLHTALSVLGVMGYPEQELRHAWRLLLLNHPHDSICGCSVDTVHDEMQTRTQRFHQVLDALDVQARQALSGGAEKEAVASNDPDFGANSLVVFNFSGHAVSGPVRLAWAALPQASLPKGSLDIQMISSSDRDELFGGRELIPYYKDVSLREAWVWCDAATGLGFTEYPWCVDQEEVADPESLNRKSVRAVEPCQLQPGARALSNEFLSVAVAIDGDLAVQVKGKSGLTYQLGHKLRDLGDGGDTYNFDPLVNDTPVYASLKKVRAGQKGPLVASLILEYELVIPEGSVEQDSASAPPAVRSNKKVRHGILTEVSVRRGSPIVYFETVWDNRARDHRLEVVFNTGAPIARSFSENHFSLIERKHSAAVVSLPVATGCEAVPDRFPCQRFFIVNQQVFLNCGLPEYAIDGQEVSITLLRAISILSRGALRTRGGGAGPHLPTPGANCLGVNQATYGWAALDCDSSADLSNIKAYSLAEQFQGTLWVTIARRQDGLVSRSLITLSNQAIRISAFYAELDGRAIILRLLNVTGVSQSVELGIGFGYGTVYKTGLDGKQTGQLMTAESQPSAASSGLKVLGVDFSKNELITLRFNT